MKYEANPVIVDAFEIVGLPPLPKDGNPNLPLRLDNGATVEATPEMVCRMPGVSVGDFYVIQEDGYIYLNPRNVFLRKYHVKKDPTLFTKEA